ncbi:MAG: hypothetical protein COY39_01750 [Alphaproteobacteria bacterium CG_4_10_14_0_8_um_filter_37_21]|nr:MAG: hypothetical protein COY39_01750 [Alphaproteobacteria bacterium CG_4_10_14_0_8_um_filter_37_21]
MKRFLRSIVTKKTAAFSLVEIGVALLIIGVLIGAVLKGKDLLDSAKLYTITKDFQNIKHSISTYQEIYQQLPGDDPKANRFGTNITPGNGDQIISSAESSQVWVHLKAAGLWKNQESATSKLGGTYNISTDAEGQHWVTLSLNSNGDGLLTPKQAVELKAKLQSMDSDLADDDVIIDNGQGAQSSCITNGTIKHDIKKKVCIIRYKLN